MAERKRLRIAHLYPDAMDLYGDLGNVIAVRRRCQWRGIETDLVEVRVGQPADIHDADIVVMGGGQDTAQSRVAVDIVSYADTLRSSADEGAAMLAVCGGFQLFGNEYVTASGERLPGIGVFDALTLAGPQRFIGNVSVRVVLPHWDAEHVRSPIRVVGYENHSGLTRLRGETEPLGTILRGAGNLGDGSVEGAVYRNAIGTYLHGPLLPKNPILADHLIIAALVHRYGAAEELPPLDDDIEMDAHRVAVARCDTGRVADLRALPAGEEPATALPQAS